MRKPWPGRAQGNARARLDGPWRAPRGPPAAGDQRVLKTAVDSNNVESHTAYIFDTLELRRTAFTSAAAAGNASGEADYQLSAWTEVLYLNGGAVRLARVVWEPSDKVPTVGASQTHVLLELGDHLGSTSVVLDHATGELVERSAFYALGATESDYRPERWSGFREDYQFTGKEEDVEVGLTYFGKRFLSAYLGRWASADPLAVHALGADLNVYAYVSGKLLQSVDPVGLEGTANGDSRATVVVLSGGQDFHLRNLDAFVRKNYGAPGRPAVPGASSTGTPERRMTVARGPESDDQLNNGLDVVHDIARGAARLKADAPSQGMERSIQILAHAGETGMGRRGSWLERAKLADALDFKRELARVSSRAFASKMEQNRSLARTT